MPGKELHHEITIQGYHIDVAGHVNNAVYLQWLDEARARLLDVAGFPLEALVRRGICPVLTRTENDYIQPLAIGGQVHMTLWLSSLGRASLEVHCAFHNREGALCARAKQKGTFLNLETGRPWRLTPEVRDALAAYLVVET